MTMASIDPVSKGHDDQAPKRRRFQAPITNFFAPSSPSEADFSSSHSKSNHESLSSTSTPTLPAKVQSSLLTVGMRIRKSVPEGYKTTEAKPSSYSSIENDTQCRAQGTYTELTPYCGIMKTGGLSVQTFPRPVEMDVSGTRRQQLFDQDGKVFSTGEEAVMPPASNKKRGFELEEEEGEDLDEESMPSSSQSSMPSLASSQSSVASATSALSSSRRILLPNFAGQRRIPRAPLKGGEGQENMAYPSVVDDDFEEATFLQRKEDVDMDI